MSESHRGRDPGKPQAKNIEYVLYHRAAKYPDDASSRPPYDSIQDLIRDNECNLSVFRMRMGEDIKWNVAVIGTPPPEVLDRRVVESLASGEEVVLPDWAVERLYKRRQEVSGEGRYVEKHHRPRKIK